MNTVSEFIELLRLVKFNKLNKLILTKNGSESENISLTFDDSSITFDDEKCTVDACEGVTFDATHAPKPLTDYKITFTQRGGAPKRAYTKTKRVHTDNKGVSRKVYTKNGVDYVKKKNSKGKFQFYKIK